jgi:DNA-binding GntR family transcriptional regulator
MASSTAERLKLELEREILMFRLHPGERLDENRLAQRYGTSRTPVREALRQLAASGLVDIRPHRSAEVARLSIPQLLEMFELMSVMEGVCARFAAERASAAEIQRIRDAHEGCRTFVDARDPDGFYHANNHFHDAIYQASHNSYCAEQTQFLRNRLSPYRRCQLHRNNRPEESFREHERILEAISQGDAARAEREIRAHIDVQGTNISAFISNVPPQFLASAPPQPRASLDLSSDRA